MDSIMWVMTDQCTSITITVWMLLLLLHANDSAEMNMPMNYDNDDEDYFHSLLSPYEGDIQEMHNMFYCTLQNFKLCTTINFYGEDIGYWIKPHSTTWFSHFLTQYYNSRWVKMFRIPKDVVFSLVELLKPHVTKQDTHYYLAILVLIRVACTLFKLAHRVNLTVCSEMFAIGRSSVSKILGEVVHSINNTLKYELKWPSRDRVTRIQEKFANFCGLLAVVEAIDGVHIGISKPLVGAPDYYYFKRGRYTINCHAIVDRRKRFLDMLLGMSESTNDACMLRHLLLYSLAAQGLVLESHHAMQGNYLYLVEDLGYPLLPWLMVPHKSTNELSIFEAIFNRKLKQGHSVVENAFGILKQTFRELLSKSDLHITFLPDVILCCGILHNILFKQSHKHVEQLLSVMRTEGLQREVVDDEVHVSYIDTIFTNILDTSAAITKRQQLGVFLTTCRHALFQG